MCRSLLFLLLLTLIPVVLPAQERTISLEPILDTNIVQLWPGLFTKGKNVYVTWGEQRPIAGSSQRQVWYTIGRWPENSETFAPIIATLKPDTLSADDPATMWPYGFGHSEQPQSYDGAVFAGSSHWREDQQKAAPNDIIYKARYSVYVPDGSGWKTVKIFDDKKSGTEVAVAVHGNGYNPNTGELLTAWTSGTSTTGTVTSVDTAGNIRWTVTGIPMAAREVNIVPIGNREFLAIIDSVVTRYANGTLAATWKIPSVFRPRYQRLGDARFLRYYTDTTVVTKLAVEIFSYDGTPGNSYVLNRNDTLANHTITQSQYNSDIAVISSGPLGVYLNLFDGHLAPTGQIFKISSAGTAADTAGTVAAVFTRDSLYVLWQNYHNGAVDLHGNAVPAREGGNPPVSAPDDRGFAFSVSAVVPNPAREAAGFGLELPRAASVDVDLTDQLGRVVHHDVRHLSEGYNTVDLDLAGLPNGAYTVVVRTGGRVSTSKLMIVR
ncbi:MAG: T9SS type A sorting domain-containing protein [Candidatus Kapaibacterium sp.]